MREAWESPATGASLTAGLLAPDGVLRVTSEIDGVVFGDGIEDDRLEVEWGQRVEISAARSGCASWAELRGSRARWRVAARPCEGDEPTGPVRT